MATLQFRITNLTCEACVRLSDMALKKLSGVTHVSVDLATGKTEVCSEREIDTGEIVRALKAVGKEVTFTT